MPAFDVDIGPHRDALLVVPLEALAVRRARDGDGDRERAQGVRLAGAVERRRRAPERVRRTALGVLACGFAQPDADDDQRERDALAQIAVSAQRAEEEFEAREEKGEGQGKGKGKGKGTHDDGVEGVDADVLRVGVCDVRREEGDERGGVDRGGLDDRLDDGPVRERGVARAVLLHFVVRPHDARGEEDWYRGQRGSVGRGHVSISMGFAGLGHAVGERKGRGLEKGMRNACEGGRRGDAHWLQGRWSSGTGKRTT